MDKTQWLVALIAGVACVVVRRAPIINQWVKLDQYRFLKEIAVISAVVMIVLIIYFLLPARSPSMKHGEILPVKEMQEKYNLYAENRPEIKLDAEKVPEELRGLIPYAEKWGISDDIIRDDFTNKASVEEKKELVDKVGPYLDEINAYLDSLPDDDGSDEGSAFLYLGSAWEEVRMELK